jgi:hypothetical protein
MSIQVQLRQGTAAENSAFTGAEGELVYTTDTKKLFVHDGSTLGGLEVGAVTGIADDSVTFAKIEEIPANTILGNNTGSSSDILELSVAQTQSLLNVANGATANSSDATLLARANHTGTQTLATISDAGTAASADTGDFAAASHTHTAANITDFDTEVANNTAVAANTAKVTNATHTGDVTGATALTIANAAVDSDKLSTTLDFGSIV